MSKLNPKTLSQAIEIKQKPVVKQPQKVVLTENGALAYNTTGSILVDFFSRFGGMRESSEHSILSAFYSAFNVFPVETIKLLMFFRDCRGGQGERRIFDVVYQDLILNDNPLAYQLLAYVPEYGYWKDVRDFLLIAEGVGNTKFADFACELFVTQLLADANSKNMTLCAKYAPSETWSNRSSINKKVWKRYIRFVSRIMKIQNVIGYRYLLSKMRLALPVLERQMSDQDWNKIDFASVPSKAHALYRKAFGKHQQERYAEYLANLEKGQTKINASVLTPYDVVKKYMDSYGYLSKIDKTLEEQWKALPNYVNHDVLAISDTSGSMAGEPMIMSIALGIYFAQRAKGVCKGELVNFDSKPAFHDISNCKSLFEAIQKVSSMPWGGSTNFVAVFDMLLSAAIKNKASQEDLPKFLLCISDMQFNTAGKARGQTPFEVVRQKFENAGYKLPQFIFWNVRASALKNFPTFDEDGVMQVSGSSPAVLQFVMATLNNNSFEVIQRILDNPRYKFVENLEYFS